MKKTFSMLILFIILFTSLIACNQKDNLSNDNIPKVTPSPGTTPSITSPAPEERVSDYFPFMKDVHMIYKGTGNEYAPYETYVDYVKGKYIQVRNINGGTTMVNVYQINDGILKKVFAQGEIYYRYDYTTSSNKDEIIIREPIKEGESWQLNDGATRSITAINKEINVPAGSYKALEITTKRQESITKDYYVKDIGLVKSEFTLSDGSSLITSELEKIEKDIPFKQRVKLYFPDFSKEKVVYVYRDINIYTNEDMIPKFQEQLKTVFEDSELAKVLSSNATILGYNIDDEKGIVTVDFSEQLIKEMNAGSLLESMIIKSIVNTFGDYYQKNKVIITIEGKPYESGHILMKKNEYFNTETKGVEEYKNP